MRIGEKMRKWISMILCLCMLVQNAPMMVFAASTDNLCEHHPKHTEDCGYVEAVAGSACTHKHSEACYKIVECKHTCSDECGDPCTTHTCTVDNGCITMERDCHHVHGECSYAEAVEPQDCTTCQPVLVHAENCSYVESADEVTCDCEPTVIHGGEGCTYVEGKDGSPCTHVCAVVVDSDDSCYKLLCSHKDGGHDDACGYAAAVEGHECHYECSACEDNAGDDSPVPEGVCAHGNSEENCETCVGEIQVMINALPDMEDIGDHNRADVISQLEAIDDRMCKLSDAAKGKLNADKYVDAAFVLSAPEGFFGFILSKAYEAGASEMPQASFAFLDASGVAATVITPEEQQTTSVEPVSNGGAVRGYLPVGEYTLDETVVGDWNLTMSVNGQAEGDHTFTGEGGRAYRIETINILPKICLTISGNGLVKVKNAAGEEIVLQDNKCRVTPDSYITLTVEPEPGYVCDDLKVMRNDEVIALQEEGNTYTFQMSDEDVNVTATFKPLCEHTTENAENQATCKKQAVCDLCGESYGEVNKNNHDASEAFDNGFCPNGCYESAKLVDGVYQISNAGQLYWFAEQVNSGDTGINGKLTADIVVNENVLEADGTPNDGEFRDWTPMGKTGNLYTGTFDGDGNTISGLYFDNDNVDDVGLFGYVDSGKIQNVSIKDSYFNGGDNVGSVVAYNYQGTVTGCYNTGTVSGGSYVGGVAGYSGGKVSNCYNTGIVRGRYMVGGVLGLNREGSTLSNCYNTGEVNGAEIVGGVLGLNREGSELINCYNTGKVSGKFNVGGVAGENYQGTISNCYYLTGTVNGGIDGADAAGQAEAMIKNLFASGEVAYLLGVPFGQNIDNDQTKQEIPCFSNAIVCRVKNCKGETVYSNTDEDIDHKWENGKCSICGTPCSHNSFNSDTGECSDCKTNIAVAMVEIGDTTYFKTLDEAVDAAENATTEAPATLTLLKDIDLEDSYPTISSGVMILDLNGCKLTGSDYYVLDITGNATGKPDVTITDSREGGTISATQLNGHGVRANNSTVTINGGTVSGDGYGVSARQGTVTITGGTISGGAAGVNADSNSTVTISGGAISNGTYGVIANFGTVEITGGTITGTSSGVDAYKSTVKISGGTITGGNYDLEVSDTASIILGLGKDGTVATFPGGLNVDGTTLKAILGEGAAYWQEDKMIFLSDGQTEITDGDVTVKAECEHGNATYPAEYITNTQHKVDCPCGYVATEDHTFDSTTGKCSACGAREIFFEADVSWNKVYAYYWDNINHVNPVTWPGVELTKNDGDPRYRLVVPGDTTHIIFNDGNNNGNKTDDLELGVKNCYHYDGNNGYWYTYPCMKHIWGEDGKCSNCRTVCPHNSFNSTTGLCTDCKTDIAVASVKIGGTTTKFKTLANAVGAAEKGTAEAPATLTLLKDIDLGESYQQIDSGVFTLDLNGCTLEGIGSYVLYISGTETHKPDVTITDSKEGGTISATGTGTTTSSGCDGVHVFMGTLTIKNGTISASGSGVISMGGAVNITGGTVSGNGYGVNAMNSTVKISGGTITGSDKSTIGVNIVDGTVEISSGTISGYCGVFASSNSTVEISGGTISGTKFGVYANESTVKIEDGTITATVGSSYGMYAEESTVTITGGTISASDYGVHSIGGTLTVAGGTITGAPGLQVTSGTLTISDGTITVTGDSCVGVYARSDSNVEISGGTITATGDYCVGVDASSDSTVKISGGEISATGEYSVGVIADESIVTISGGEISGEANDLRVFRTGSITLTLAVGAKKGATFPGGLTVYETETTLVDILANGAAYWQGTKMLTNIADDAITITGGDVTVKAVCKHENPNYSVEGVTDATKHNVVCSECDNVLSTESHTRTYTASGNVITDSCSQCKATFGTATITANGKTYNGESVTAAVQKTGALTDSSIGITYSQNGEELNESAIRAGTYTASIKLGNAVAKVNFTITPATLPNAVLSATGYTYNGQQQKPAVTVTGLTENTDYTVTYPQDVTNAGEKTVTITGKGNYTGTVTKSYSIAKADSAVTKAPQAAANLVYNGKNQNLVIAGTVTGGTLQYSLDGKTWAAKIPVGKAAGTYTVSYKVVGDANHKDIAVRTLAVTIAKGTAPAVDALVQTHFYAYATANTVDLAKYLPADRGTTAYTAIGVSADIFSSALTVTNAGVLSYTTRKLTAAPASDTQISIKVVMENYADAELTVIVKLLAVTAQTQQKIVKEELTEVPAGLAGTRFHSVNAIKTEQKRVLGLLLGYDPQGNILHYDVKLQFSPDGGKTWVDATEENFPANGLTVTLPYPSGTGKDTHNFVVSHMFTTGAKAGTIETPAVTKTAEGIQFTVTGLSPVSVAWSAIPFDVKVANVTNGTVYVSSAQAAAGTQVTITATPKSGYRLSTLTVKDAAGNFCVVSTDNNGKYYFTMPAADVTVTATFTAKSTAVADTTNPKTGDDSNLVFWNSMAMTSLLALAVLMLNKKKLHQK